MWNSKGFTLLQLMLTISVLLILLIVGAPSFVSAIKHHQLKGALQTSYYLLQQAKSLAISQATAVGVQFIGGENWCLAVSQQLPCDCNLAQDCHVEQQEYRLDAAAYPQIGLTRLRMGKHKRILFDGVHGIAVGNAGSVQFSAGETQSKLIVSNLGRVRICMLQGQLGAFAAC